MEIGEIRVASSKENSSMASIWTTFLCLERLSEDEYQVCIRAYEILCTADDIREELNLIEDMYFDIYEHLPDIYNGKKVEGIDDGEYIFGGDLEKMNNFMFNEELGAVIQVKNELLKEVIGRFSNKQIESNIIGKLNKSYELKIVNNKELFFKDSIENLHKIWHRTSYEIQRIRDNKKYRPAYFVSVASPTQMPAIPIQR